MSEPSNIDIEPGVTEADRLIAAALADHVRRPAPRRLREQLMQTHLTPRRRWLPVAVSSLVSAALAAAVCLLVVRPPASDAAASDAVAIDEIVGDHQRIINRMVASNPPHDVVSNNFHNVKPWFAGLLDFVPPVSFEGDSEFPLEGGDLAVFRGHKAAAFVFGRRKHTISLLMFAEPAASSREEATVRGFHVITWTNGGFGMALVSDVSWDDLRLLESRLRN